MPLPVACVLFPLFSVHIERQHHPALARKPLVITGGPKLTDPVLDYSPQAEASGVRAGMAVRHVMALCKDAVLLPADTQTYAERFHAVLDALQQVSPTVEPGDLGCAYLGLRGLESLYRSAEALAEAIQLHVQPVVDRAPHIGIALGKFPAYVAAIHTNSTGLRVIPANETRQFLAPLSVAHLPLSLELRSRLARLGLTTLGHIADLPQSAVQAQFGQEGGVLWQLANGEDERPLVPRPHALMVRETLTFPGPVAAVEPLLVGLERLLQRAYARPALRGRCARTVLLEGYSVSGERVWSRRMVFHDPFGSPGRALAILKGQVQAMNLPGALEELAITLTDIGGEAGPQASLLPEVRQREALQETVRELRVRLQGRAPLSQIREVEPWSRIPERRRVLVPVSL